MTEAVAVPKPGKAKSNKTLFAGMLVFVLLAAFAAAFYFLGGVDLVSNGLGGLFSASTPAPSSPSGESKPGAAVPATSTASGGLNLPPGVDEAFAKRMYVEQLESEANIQKLVTDKVASFEFGKVSAVDGGTEVELRANFRDKTSGKGVLGLAQKQGSWYFVFVSGKRGAATGGQADSVSSGSTQGFTTNDTAFNDKPVDTDVLNAILDQQVKSQDIFKGIVDGTFTNLTVDKVTQGAGTATLEITLTGPKSAAMKGRVLCISKDIDGTPTWFITSFLKA